MFHRLLDTLEINYIINYIESICKVFSKGIFKCGVWETLQLLLAVEIILYFEKVFKMHV